MQSYLIITQPHPSLRLRMELFVDLLSYLLFGDTMKTAVITGGTRVIGAALVKAFLEEGWNVVYSGTSEESIA